MYLQLPITISNLLDTNYFDTQYLKLIKIYDKAEREAAVIWVNVAFYVDNPLPLGFKVPIYKYEEQWLPFLYESMSLTCFQCGHIGHHFKECKMVLELVEESSDSDLSYNKK